MDYQWKRRQNFNSDPGRRMAVIEEEREMEEEGSREDIEAKRRAGQEGAESSDGGMFREGLENDGLCRMQCRISDSQGADINHIRKRRPTFRKTFLYLKNFPDMVWWLRRSPMSISI